MKVKARKRIPVETTLTVNFQIGKRLKIETEKINFTLVETEDKLVIELDKAYYLQQTGFKEWVIHSKTLKKPSKNNKMLSDIKSYINWSKVSNLLAGNPSTIRKGHTPKKYRIVVDELLQEVNEWIVKQKSLK